MHTIDADKLGNAVLMADATFLFLLLSLFFTLKDEFWVGIISFFCSFLLAVSYLIYSQLKDN
jgi:hypothetical protein